MTEKTFSQISAELDASLNALKTKKDALDKANTAVQIASNEYTDAINKASALRGQLQDSLDKVLPDGSSRVRMTG